jgi:hypothetical protein
MFNKLVKGRKRQWWINSTTLLFCGAQAGVKVATTSAQLCHFTHTTLHEHKTYTPNNMLHAYGWLFTSLLRISGAKE